MKINFNEPFISGLEKEFILDVFEQNRFYGNGKYTQLSTNLIKNRISSENVLLTDSCTSALEIVALLLRDYKKEQEIILPSYTFSSTASAFARAGFKLVFAEINPHTMMLDPNDIEKRITEKTVAVVTVHYAGYCCELEKISLICKKHEIKLVEDAAQAFDSYLKGKALGTFGDFGCFSFHETKNIHAGLSGALTIQDPAYVDRATYIWERGTNRQEVLKGLVDKYSWVEIGGSFYPTEFQAAFLYAQLLSLDENVAKRKAIYDVYHTNLSLLKEEKILDFPSFENYFKSNFHAFFIRLNSEEECDKVRECLVRNNISAYIGYVPLHSSKVGLKMGYTKESLPITEYNAKCVLRLPFHNNLTIEDVHFMTLIIKESLGFLA